MIIMKRRTKNILVIAFFVLLWSKGQLLQPVSFNYEQQSSSRLERSSCPTIMTYNNINSTALLPFNIVILASNGITSLQHLITDLNNTDYHHYHDDDVIINLWIHIDDNGDNEAAYNWAHQNLVVNKKSILQS